MPYFKVLMDNKFGEGFKTGDVIEMDTLAAKVRLELGEIEEVNEADVEKPATSILLNEEDFTELGKSFCDSCDSRGVRHKKVCPKFVVKE